MRVVVSDEAARLIDERGGRLYVWATKARCCGGSTRLETASDPPGRRDFEQVDAGRFALYMPSDGSRPEELHLEAKRFPRRVEAYWNGCAWVV